jgi:hypothetical protein
MRLIDFRWPACRSVAAVARNLAVLVAAIAVATVVALAACTDTILFAEAWDVHGSVWFTSTSADSVVAEVVMVNRVRKTVQAHAMTTCPPVVDVEVRTVDAPEGEPVWEYRPYFDHRWACLAVVFPPVDVPPGDSVVYRVDFPVSAVLGDTLPAGPYAFTGVMLGLGATNAGTYRTVDLGTLTLGLAPTP